MDDERPMDETSSAPPLPSVQAAVELRESVALEDQWKARLLDPRASTAEIQEAAREVVAAHLRTKAARGLVGIETGALELSLLQDDRPRFRG